MYIYIKNKINFVNHPPSAKREVQGFLDGILENLGSQEYWIL